MLGMSKTRREAIIAGQAPQVVLELANRRLKAIWKKLLDALQGELTASHRFLLNEILHHTLHLNLEQTHAKVD